MRNMPKTYTGLFGGIVDFDNLLAAYQDARRGKRFNSEVLEFSANLEEELINIQNHLMWGTWVPGRYKCFICREPKLRFIQAPPFRDRVVHHALVNVIEPLFERRFIDHSYACRSNKGTHAAVDYVQQNLRAVCAKWDKVYVLKADIAKYFPSIHHRVLDRVLQRVIRDRNVLRLCQIIISYGGIDGRGIPVGALTSQLFANIYLDQLDHYIKDGLGVQYYVRYMDDWVVLGPNKAVLNELLFTAGAFIEDKLRLRLNPKTQIFPASHGIDFCGYRVWPTHRLPRKKNIKRTKKRFIKLADKYAKGQIQLHEIRPYVMSFLGYMKHCDGYHTTDLMLQRFRLQRIEEIKDGLI